MAKQGRPTKYDESLIPKIIPYLADGKSIEQLSIHLGITKETLYVWLKDPEKKSFSDAIKIGLEHSHAWWLEKGREGVTNKDIQATMWYMNMKNRFGWADKVESKQTHTVNLWDKETALNILKESNEQGGPSDSESS